MISKTISMTNRLLFSIFLSTLILIFIFYFFLTQGIQIKHFHLFGIHIEKLYLKLDKKLIVKADHITLPSSQKRQQNFSVPKEFFYINAIPKLFSSIHIDSLCLQDQCLDIHYNANTFNLQSKDFSLQTNLFMKDKKLYATIKKLLFKPYHLTLKGKLIGFNDRIFFQGEYDIEGIKGKLSIKKVAKKISFYANSIPFQNTNLKRVFTHIKTYADIKKWSYEKIVAKEYRLLSLKANFDLNKPFYPKNIQAHATAKDVKIKFHPTLPPAHTKRVILRLRNNNLFFKLIQPTYQKKSLKGSYVKIYHLFNTNSFIHIFIKTKTAFDKEIKNLLAAFKVDVPIEQKRGLIDSRVLIKIPFSTMKTDLKALFLTNNALINIDGVDFTIHQATIKLHNSFILIKPSLLSLYNILTTKVSGFLDLKKQRGEMDLDIQKLLIKESKTPLLQAKNIKEKLFINFAQQNFSLKYLKSDIHFFSTKHIEIVLKELSSLIPYSPILQKIAPKSGRAKIKIANNISFFAHIKKPNSILLKNAQPLKHFTIKGVKKADLLSIQINDFLKVSFKHPINAYLHNIDLNLSSFEIGSSAKKLPPLKINISNVKLFYKKSQLFIQKALLTTYPNIKLHIINSKERIDLFKDKNITLQAKEISSKTISKLFNIHFLDGGVFNIVAKGSKEDLQGSITIQKSLIKDLKLINNLFAFFNTIPSLITLSDPGFSQDGFLIQQGRVDFKYKKNILLIPKLILKGKSITFEGYGVVDLSKKKINMSMQLKTLQKVTNIVKNIPIAGYILFGKDGSVSIPFSLTGRLNDPQIKTQIAKKSIKYPFGIIQRTFELPFKLFQ